MRRKRYHLHARTLKHVPKGRTRNYHTHESISIPNIVMIHRKRLVGTLEPFGIGDVSVG